MLPDCGGERSCEFLRRSGGKEHETVLISKLSLHIHQPRDAPWSVLWQMGALCLGKGSPVHCSPLLFTGKHLCISWKINKIASEKCMAPIFTYFSFYHPSYGKQAICYQCSLERVMHSRIWQISLQKKPNPVVNTAAARPK